MRRPTWHRDWAGFSGGWYGATVDNISVTVVGVYHSAYILNVTAPLIGDLSVGYATRYGRRNPYLPPHERGRALIWNRRSLRELREAEAEAQRRNEIRARRLRRIVADD